MSGTRGSSVVAPGVATSGTVVGEGEGGTARRARPPAESVAARVRRRLATEGLDLSPVAIAAAVRGEAGAPILGEETLRRLTQRLTAEFTGAGPLAPLLAGPDVTDVLVNGDEVWVDRGRGLEQASLRLGGPDEVRRLAQRLASMGGRRLDDACPYVDAQLPDGTRLHAVLPPIARTGPYLSLRTFRRRGLSLGELVSCGTLGSTTAGLLAAVVSARLPYVISGGAGSGKTTLLSALLGLVPSNERIVIVEDSAELRPAHPHALALQARVSNVEGAGQITLRDLVRQALRMRPDRLVIGECRGAEVVDLLGALNTGHEGGAATLHANSPLDVPARLEALGLLGGVPRVALHAQIAAALRIVVHLRRAGPERVVEAVCVLSAPSRGGLVTVVPAWQRGAGAGPGAATLARLLDARGVRPSAMLTAQPSPSARPSSVAGGSSGGNEGSSR